MIIYLLFIMCNNQENMMFRIIQMQNKKNQN